MNISNFSIVATDQESVDSISAILDQCAKDEDSRKDFEMNPRTVLAKAGFEIPHGIDIEMVSNSEDTYHLVLPSDPNAELSDDMLKEISGGSTKSTVASILSTLSTISTACAG